MTAFNVNMFDYNMTETSVNLYKHISDTSNKICETGDFLGFSSSLFVV